MALYRWPTDPAGKPAAHSIPWNTHQQHLAAQRPAPRPAAPAAAPVAPVAATPRPAPADPIYEAQMASLARQRDEAIAGYSTQRTGGLADYGYTEGAGGALAFDPNNPFSKAAQLKRNYDTSRRSTGQQVASTGGLYAGGYQNAQDLVNRNELGAQDSMQKALASFLAQNTAARTRAGASYESQAQIAGGERTARIDDNPLYEPTIAAPAAAKPKAKAAAKPKPTPAQQAAAYRRQQAANAKAAEARAKAKAKAKRKK